MWSRYCENTSHGDLISLLDLKIVRNNFVPQNIIVGFTFYDVSPLLVAVFVFFLCALQITSQNIRGQSCRAKSLSFFSQFWLLYIHDLYFLFLKLSGILLPWWAAVHHNHWKENTGLLRTTERSIVPWMSIGFIGERDVALMNTCFIHPSHFWGSLWALKCLMKAKELIKKRPLGSCMLYIGLILIIWKC